MKGFNAIWKSGARMGRRDALKRMAGGVGALAIPPALLARAREAAATPLPRLAQDAQADERYWEMVKARFPIRPGLIMMNSANLCPTHYAVLDRVFALTRDMDGDVSFQNRGKFGGLGDRSREAIARYMGAETDEICIARNTSEANNIVVGGLDLNPGDEVVLWDQNHPSNGQAWDVRAQRRGFTVKRVATPTEPTSPDDLMKPFVDAFTSNTKVFAASHVSNTSGFGLPIRELSRICRERGIVTLVDGAQTFGALALDLHDLGCDYYTGSIHKWPMGPKETGLLYVRRGMAEPLWPSVVSVGYSAAPRRGAQKFESMGQRDDPTVAAVADAFEFLEAIGKERIEARLRQICDALREGIARIPGAFIHTPAAPEMSAAVLVFGFEGVRGRDAHQALYERFNVGSASTACASARRSTARWPTWSGSWRRWARSRAAPKRAA
jgi:selenocysteine lyase/cysteine desulfurase